MKKNTNILFVGQQGWQQFGQGFGFAPDDGM
jgi:hypothetical protein